MAMEIVKPDRDDLYKARFSMVPVDVLDSDYWNHFPDEMHQLTRLYRLPPSWSFKDDFQLAKSLGIDYGLLVTCLDIWRSSGFVRKSLSSIELYPFRDKTMHMATVTTMVDYSSAEEWDNV